MPASSSKDPYLLHVLRGSFWPFGGLFPPPFSLGLVLFFELGRDAAGFSNSAACTHAPATFTFAARALRLVPVVLDLAPLVGTRGSELDLDPAPGVKVWCLEEVLGPAPGTQTSCPLATRTRAVPGRRLKPALNSRRKPGYRSIPIRDCQKQKQKEQSGLDRPKLVS